MKKGNKTKPEEIIRILRSVEILISQGKTIGLDVKMWELLLKLNTYGVKSLMVCK